MLTVSQRFKHDRDIEKRQEKGNVGQQETLHLH